MFSVVNKLSGKEVWQERRGAPRKKVSKLATISNKNSYICRCVIKDISLTGAKLAVPEHSWVPDAFKMICPDGEYALNAEKVWSKRGHIGVKFQPDCKKPKYP